jgi:hypothetical protein
MEQRGIGLTFVGAVLILVLVVGVIWLGHHFNNGIEKNKPRG